MAEEVVLHIGQPKTATTSLQHALARNRQLLAGRGVVYPARGAAHHGAVADLQVMAGHFSTMHADRLESSRERFAGQWEALLAEVGRAGGRVVISSEGLCFLDPAGVARALSDLRQASGAGVRVVVAYREVDELLISYYVERSRYSLPEPLPAFIAGAVECLASEELGTLSWLSVPRLRTLWSAADEVVTVAFATTDPNALDRLIREVVGFSLPTHSIDRRNVGSSLAGLLAWRMFLTRHPGLPHSVIDRVRAAVARSLPLATDKALGGSIALTAQARTTLREVFAQDREPGTLPQDFQNQLQQDPMQLIEVGLPPDLDVRRAVFEVYRQFERELLKVRVRRLPSRAKRLSRAISGGL